jgi:hypothetical protein
MAQFGASITKDAVWRGSRVRWSNRYHFIGDVNVLLEAEMLTILDALRDIEKPVHSPDVSFVEGKLWGPTGVGQAASLMRASRNWTAQVGTAPTATQPIYRECAFLIQWPLGRYGSKNRPQFLRKWLHPYTNFGLSVNETAGVSPIGSTPAAIATYRGNAAALVVSGVAGSPFPLCTREGRQPIQTGSLYSYLEHRQFGR